MVVLSQASPHAQPPAPRISIEKAPVPQVCWGDAVMPTSALFVHMLHDENPVDSSSHSLHREPSKADKYPDPDLDRADPMQALEVAKGNGRRGKARQGAKASGGGASSATAARSQTAPAQVGGSRCETSIAIVLPMRCHVQCAEL